MLFVSVTSIFGQTTETFETETTGAIIFTDNGQTFTISSQSGGTFSIFDYNTINGSYGWDGTAPDFKSIDNTNQALIGVPAGFTIKSATGFLLKSFYLLALREDLSAASGTCVLTGKLSGVTQFTVSSTSFNTDLNSMNGFTLIDMTVFGGENNANKAIDELVISTTTGSTYETLALDAWKWQKIVNPTVATSTPATSIGATKAIAGGNVTADGGATVDTRGIVWATTTNPTTANNTVTSGTGTGLFSSTLSGLPAATLIYYRAFATNGSGTSYGALASFTTTAALTATQSKTDVSCKGGSNGVLEVNVSGGGGSYTYLWTPGGGTDAIFSGLTAGNYSCLIKDSELTELTKNFTITEPTTVIMATTVVTNVSCNGVSNGAINLTASGGTPGYTYNWGGGITTEDRTGLAAGTYSVIITDANGCTANVSATITEPTVIDATVSVVSGVITANQSGATYQWYQCSNILLVGENNQSFTPTNSGDYQVVVTIGTCSQTSTCVTISTLGTQNIESKIEIAVYPNPSSDAFFIDSKENGVALVFDVLGKTIQSQKITSGTTKLDLNNAPNGVYLLKVINDNNQSKTIKLIKK